MRSYGGDPGITTETHMCKRWSTFIRAHTHTRTHAETHTHTLLRSIRTKEKLKPHWTCLPSSPTSNIVGLSQSRFTLTSLMLESLCSDSSFTSVAFKWHCSGTAVLPTGSSTRCCSLPRGNENTGPSRLFVTALPVQVSAKTSSSSSAKTFSSFSSSASVPVLMLPNNEALAS